MPARVRADESRHRAGIFRRRVCSLYVHRQACCPAAESTGFRSRSKERGCYAGRYCKHPSADDGAAAGHGDAFCLHPAVFASSGAARRLRADVPDPAHPLDHAGLPAGHAGDAADAAADLLLVWAGAGKQRLYPPADGYYRLFAQLRGLLCGDLPRRD